MSVDRVATSTQSAYLTTQLLKQEAKVSTLSSQVASGQVSSSYAGYGDKTMAMESARATVNRTTAYQTATNLALTQTELQDNQLSQLSTLAGNLKEAVSNAVATGDGSTLSTTCSDIFDSVAAILNYKDSNGTYIYGGGNDTDQPFSVASFGDLATATLSSSFNDGTATRSVQVADGQSIDTGLTASAVGTQLMTVLQNISSYIDTNGDFTDTITAGQENFLTQQITAATGAYKDINQTAAANGSAYNQLQDAADTQTTMLTLYKGFVSDIQDVDMTTAATNLSNAQVALQAVVQVTSTLNSVSLLDYLK
jgi:flagellar hook-associated protein 3 FlgL